MRLASNRLKDILSFYDTELASVYDKNERDALTVLAVEHYLSRSEQFTNRENNVNQSDLIKLYDCAKTLKQLVPLQYILGEAWFYHLKFRVTPQVLIPRPETEELVDLVLKENTSASSFLDIGTGSGCIPITLKKNLPTSQVSACDISPGALTVSRNNAQQHHSAVNFYEADVLDRSTFLKKIPGPFEVVISNPPYIQLSEKPTMAIQVKDHEPDLALFVEGDDAILFYRKIIDLCGPLLTPKGRLYFELNPLTAENVKAYAQDTHLFSQVLLLKDLSGKIRFLKAVKH